MKDETTYLFKKLKRQISLCCGSMALVVVITILLSYGVFRSNPMELEEIALNPIESKYDISLLDNSGKNEIIKFGHELFTNTPKYLGPDNGKPDMVYSGNRLACNNCHLQSGTKLYSAPLIGIINRFPQFRGRENKIGTIEERINGCFERSMNGRVIPVDGKEMNALVQYLTWLSRFAPEDGKITGQGFVEINIPNRKVNLAKGKRIFTTICTKCHGSNGQGERTPDGFTYKYPPLWGEDSYNNGAGMNRVITAAQFIKGNMPYGITYDNPLLTDEEAYDVSGYINQQKRPEKLNREKDFPDLKKKPVSTPYPPYADLFSIDQHQMGPFQPIMEFYKQEYNMIKNK
ncbi:thiosulfate dehydrogenase [Saonia flava]|uniref:Thiosulfate dehydrogenase n=1 Tax=Saonia flava TaxID=523696 RepID=A0A846QTG8_9FLAO|nr:c-type cytochrome [Saonia flava]NJB70260.1 thiosulfate dehydrogenase [Saonia flava]